MGTIKQKEAAKEMAKKVNGKSNIKTAQELLEKVSYSKGISEQPSRVLKSKGFLEEFNKLVPDDKLTKKHNQLLNDAKSEIQLKALDMAYKVKGNYAPDKKQTVSLNLNTEIKSSQESRDLVDEYEERVANMLRQKK